MNNYIKERSIFYAQNISDFEIGDSVKDFDGKICKIVNKTSNSIEVLISKKSNAGVDLKIGSKWVFLIKGLRKFNVSLKLIINYIYLIFKI